jgi:hypothetical protein
MLNAKDIVVWVNNDSKEVMVRTHGWGVPEHHFGSRSGWGDPIGAAYSQWHEITNAQRVQLMLETAIDLSMHGFALQDVLVALSPPCGRKPSIPQKNPSPPRTITTPQLYPLSARSDCRQHEMRDAVTEHVRINMPKVPVLQE